MTGRATVPAASWNGKVGARTESTRRPLTRERIVLAALDLVDDEGLESLSMRRLGRALGVESMSLYSHVANKSEILDGIVDLLFRQVKVPVVRRDRWIPFSKALFQAVRRVLLAHPRAISLLATRTASSPEALLPIDASLDALCRGGFDARSAVDGHRVLMSFTIGYAMSEVSLRSEPGVDPNAWGTAAYASRIPSPQHLQTLSALAPVALDRLCEEQFPACLDIILAGLAVVGPGAADDA